MPSPIEIYTKYLGEELARYTLIDHRNGDRKVPLTWHTSQKWATSLTDGCQCNARFAEGYRAYRPVPVPESCLTRLG